MAYDAVMELDRRGCRQIAFVDRNKDLSWSKNPDSGVRGYYDGLKNIGQLRNSQLYLKVPVSQQGGYDAFCKLLSDAMPRPFGIISNDSMLTMGGIQAVLSKKFRIPEDVIIASHANQGCGAAQFPIPIIKYEYPINANLDLIAKYIKLHNAGQNPPSGVVLLPPIKIVDSLLDKQLCIEVL